ncbi:MAG: NUDIX domain-containing protein [Chloroflexi bacterium]|nr:NUDIX domain-containing protein [Chloroflexota bacterium]
MVKKKKKRHIRPLALCVFQRGDKIFVARGFDAHKGETFYRPIGGRIEFGEQASDAVAREVREEIDAKVADLTFLGALENIFTYEGKPHHEIVMIFDGRFTDHALNQDDVTVTGVDDGEVLYESSWKCLDFFRGDVAPPLYPTGLLELLDSRVGNGP